MRSLGQGVSKIVLVPAFLAAGVQTMNDIPELIDLKEQELHRKRVVLSFYGEPLGCDDRIAEILEEKALGALGNEIEIGNPQAKFVV